MGRLNIWTYNSRYFASSGMPYCSEGTHGEVGEGRIRWDRAEGFTDLDNLVSVLRGIVGASEGEGGRMETEHQIQNLAIMCHGLPGRLQILAGGHLFYDSEISIYRDRFRAIHSLLDHSGSEGHPLILFQACAAAADGPGTMLFQCLSREMPNTRVVGFTRLLALAPSTRRELPNGGSCVLPDNARVTNAPSDPTRPVTDQPVSWTNEETLGFPAAMPRATHAREFLNGREVSIPPPGGERRSSYDPYRPRRTYGGRGISSRYSLPA